MKPFLVISVLAIVGVSCNRSPQEKAARFMTSGKYFLQRGEYTSAFLQFKNAARIDDRNPEPFYYMGLISINQGNARAAIQYLIRATQVDSKYSAAQIKLAEVMVLSRRADLLKQAEIRAKAVLSDQPDNIDALAVLASIEKRSGDLGGAERDLQEAWDRNPQSLKAAAGLASLEISRGDWHKAEAILKQATAAAPHSADPLVALGELYLLSHRDADAEAQFRHALKIDPNSVQALLHLAQMADAAGHQQEAQDIYRKLAMKNPGEFGELFAASLSQSGELNAAISEYQTVLSADPNNRRARTSMVKALLRAGRPGAAQTILKAALQNDPADIDALQQSAQLLLQSGKYEESRQTLTQLLEYEPDSAQAHYLLSGVYKAQKQFVQQYQELNEALRLKPQLLSARIELARALLRDNKAPEALELLNHAPADQQQTAILIAQRNWTFLALHDLDKFARGIPTNAVRQAPEFVLQQGLLRLAKRDFAGAETCFADVLQKSPADTRALDALLQTYILEKHPDLALQKLSLYAAKQPHSSAFQVFAGNWLLQHRYPNEAREAFTAAFAANSADADANLALAQLDEQEDQPDAARERLEKFVLRDDNAAAEVMLAELEESAGHRNTAIEHYRKAIEISPSNPAALNNLAWILSDSPNDVEQALAYAQKAKEIAPDDPAIDDTLGWILYKKGIYNQALEYVQTAAAKTHNPVSQYHLAIIYFDLGNVQLGKKALELATRLDPTLAEASIAKKALAEATRQRQN